MIGNGLNNDEECCFKFTKLTLLFFHTMGLIGATLMFFVCVVALTSVDSHDELSEKDRATMRKMTIFAIFIFAFAIIYEMIAIGGVAKENKTVVMAYLVLAILGFAGNLFYGIQTGVLTLIIICLTAYYAFILVKKDRLRAMA